MTRKTAFGGKLAVLASALLIALMLFLCYNQFNSLSAANAAAASERQEIDNARARLAQLEKVKERETELRARLETLERLLPSRPQENILINDVHDAAGASETRFMQIRFEDRVEDRDVVDMPFTIVFEGRYHGLLKLLEELQNGQRAVRIHSLKVGPGGDQLPQIKAEIGASAFYAPGTDVPRESKE